MVDRRLRNSRVAAINAPEEVSVKQARWILMPLFGLWIVFSFAGVLAAWVA